MHLVVGSYEGGLLGLQIAAAAPGSSTPLVSRRRFAYSPHSSCVKALASSGRTLVSTGTDERVLVYDLKRRSEFGTLQQHEGTVTCAEFWGGTHLLTGSEDKTIVVWRAKDWAALHTLRGHKEKLVALAIHPSGKLSLASDSAGTLYLWNLSTAKCVFRHRTPESSALRWSPDGQAYLSVHNDQVELSTTGAEKLCTLAPKAGGRIFDAVFMDDNTVVTGGESKQISLWDVRDASSEAAVVEAQQSSAGLPGRVKGVAAFTAGGAQYCAAATAQGTVAVYDTRRLDGEPVLTHDTRARLTCLQPVADFEGEDEDLGRPQEQLTAKTDEPGESDSSTAGEDERGRRGRKKRRK